MRLLSRPLRRALAAIGDNISMTSAASPRPSERLKVLILITLLGWSLEGFWKSLETELSIFFCQW